jgi:hypothetical protein
MSTATETCVWFAVLLPCRAGYALECWPDEREAYLHRLGDKIIGEFDTCKEAERAIARKLQPLKRARLHEPATKPLAPSTLCARA